MSRLVLAGGTDVWVMAFFSLDALPPKPDVSSLKRLMSTDSASRLWTGADGPCLLHVYVDGAPPPEIEAWLDTSDKLGRPGNVFVGAALLVVSMLIVGVADTPGYFAGAAVLTAAAWAWIRLIKGTAEFQDLERAKPDVEQRFPSIVIALARVDARARS